MGLFDNEEDDKFNLQKKIDAFVDSNSQPQGSDAKEIALRRKVLSGIAGDTKTPALQIKDTEEASQQQHIDPQNQQLTEDEATKVMQLKAMSKQNPTIKAQYDQYLNKLNREKPFGIQNRWGKDFK